MDDWGTTKKFEPTAERPGGFRDGPPRPGGFRDGPPRGGGGGFEPSRADESDWGSKVFTPSEPPQGRSGGGSRGFGFADRPGGGSGAQADEEDRWARRGPPEPTPTSSSAAPAERPRLNLMPRSVSVEAGVTQEEPKKPSSNPFGGARPREEILKEKGIDVKDEPSSKPPVLEAVIRCG